MPDDIQSIIVKARELSASIKEHPVTMRYNEFRERINRDRTAQGLYSKLVNIGNELNAKLSRGEQLESQPSAEYDLLQKELERNSLVKDYIQSQRDYLDLLKNVVEKIKNPSN